MLLQRKISSSKSRRDGNGKKEDKGDIRKNERIHVGMHHDDNSSDMVISTLFGYRIINSPVINM